MTSDEIQSLVESCRVLDGLQHALPEINSQIAAINDGLRETINLVEPLLGILLTTLDAAEAVGNRLRTSD